MVSRKGSGRRIGGLKIGMVGAAMTALLALTPAAGTVAQLVTAADSSSPATGHAQVVAQGVVDFSDGSYHWSVAQERVDADADDSAIKGEGPAFLLSSDGALLLTAGDDEDMLRLPSGEATFRSAGDETQLKALGTEEAGYYAIELTSGDAAGDDDTGPAAEPFTLGAGPRDVDLLRDLIDRGERMTLADGDAPALILVTDGSVVVEIGGETGETALDEGDTATLTGDLTVTNAGDAPAVVVAAVIGPKIETESEAEATTTPGDPATPPDTDGDGLSDPDEADAGTEPNNPDTDGDGLSDGQEVHTFGSDPLVTDTDDDGLMDGDEVNTHGSSPTSTDTDQDLLSDFNEVSQHNTDPAIADTDGDGVSDHDELGIPTLPLDPDSDDDGLNDGGEVQAGSDPNNPDSDNDGLLDGDEVNTHGSSPISMDTDGDLLADFNEVMQYGTNPAVNDTDGDGISDHDETSIPTNPTNPDTDGDGANDGTEYFGGTDPNDPNSVP